MTRPRDWWHVLIWMNGHIAVCHPLQPVQREETHENRKKRKEKQVQLV